MAVNTTVEVVMPAMGDSVSEGTVLEWHKQEGDQVSEDETLVEISTDKVDAEVPAPATGTVVKVHAAEGDTVHVGSVLAQIATHGAAPAAAAPAAAAAAPPAQATPEPVAEPEQGEEVLPDGIRISPVARRVAAAEGIDLSNVHGSGPGGRILKADVLGSNGKSAAAPPAAAPAQE